MKKPRLILFEIIVILLSTGCASNNLISVLEHTFFKEVHVLKHVVMKQNAAILSNKYQYKGYYKVKRGDTLYRISLDFGQDYKNIAIWNHLNNPNNIKVNQMIRVMVPINSVQTASVDINSSNIKIKCLNILSNNNTKKKCIIDKHNIAIEENNQLHSANTLDKTKELNTAIINKLPLESTKILTVANDKEEITWIWPAEGKIISQFNNIKKGINIAGKVGQPIFAASGGKIMYAGSGIRGYGNLVIVKHTSNFLSAYAHNKSILVKEGQIVTIGMKIAEMGSSDSDSVKLYFEIRHEGKPVDPFKYLPVYKVKNT